MLTTPARPHSSRPLLCLLLHLFPNFFRILSRNFPAVSLRSSSFISTPSRKASTAIAPCDHRPTRRSSSPPGLRTKTDLYRTLSTLQQHAPKLLREEKKRSWWARGKRILLVALDMCLNTLHSGTAHFPAAENRRTTSEAASALPRLT